MQSTGINNISLKGFYSTSGFSSDSLSKISKKRDIMIKPATSIGNSLPTDRHNRQDKKLNSTKSNNMNHSRFNSFLNNTK